MKAVGNRKTTDNDSPRREAPIPLDMEGGDCACTPPKLVKVAPVCAETYLHRLAHVPGKTALRLIQGESPGRV